MINLIFILLVFSGQDSFGFAKAWFSCKTTPECVKMDAGCGRTGSINIKFKDKYEKFMNKTNQKSLCNPIAQEVIEADKKSIVICSKTQCELTNP